MMRDYYGWIVFNRKRIVKITLKKPGVSKDEVAMRVHVSLPESLFTRPELMAEVKVEEKTIPTKVTAETVSRVENILRAEGIPVTIRVVEGESDAESNSKVQ